MIKCDKLSNVAFNFNVLRPYTEDSALPVQDAFLLADDILRQAGRLNTSHPLFGYLDMSTFHGMSWG